jgi:hypothetical protein
LKKPAFSHLAIQPRIKDLRRVKIDIKPQSARKEQVKEKELSSIPKNFSGNKISA